MQHAATFTGMAAPSPPWGWHGEFFARKPAADFVLLAKDFHIVSMKTNDRLSSPPTVAL